jgi:hypothetical protein
LIAGFLFQRVAQRRFSVAAMRRRQMAMAGVLMAMWKGMRRRLAIHARRSAGSVLGSFCSGKASCFIAATSCAFNGGVYASVDTGDDFERPREEFIVETETCKPFNSQVQRIQNKRA